MRAEPLAYARHHHGHGRKCRSASHIPVVRKLGLDIDAAHEAASGSGRKPHPPNVAQSLAIVLSLYQSERYYRSHSPEQAWQDLRDNLELASFSDQQLWDAVAYIWQAHTTPEALAEAEQLYARNCAACHGESGGGDGVFSGEQFQIQSDAGEMPSGHETVAPVDFTDPERMVSASPALLQGKIIRGGMGTGMPMWGSIFTEEQTWALVSYLYTFQFEEVP